MSRFLMVRDMPYPKVPWFTKATIEETLDYAPKDGDIIIASYPKTGTAWLQYIVLQVTSKGEYFPSFNAIHAKTFMEMAGAEGIDSLKGLRIYKHHYRYNMVQKNPKSKVIYIYRNPEDVFVSYFHFMESVYQQKLEFEEFFEGFITGNIEYGSYFEHVLSFLNHKDDENLFLISYEELKTKPKEGILAIAKFLGDEYYQCLSTDESLLNKIVMNTSFENMKRNLKFKRPYDKPKNSSVNLENCINLFRKGVVGDGKNLSLEHLKRIQKKAADIMKGTTIVKEWLKE